MSSSKDWVGNTKSSFAALGASNHSEEKRQVDDYYATDPIAIDILLNETDLKLSQYILEPACGEGHLSKALEQRGYKVTSFDLVDRGYGKVKDFFSIEKLPMGGVDIITNPPYKYAKEFANHALKIVKEGDKVIMFLKLTFLESKGRKQFFLDNPPKYIYVFSSRVNCAKNGDFANQPSSAVAYAWYVWVKGFQGDPIIKWVN